MTWTYSGDPSLSTKDYVRFLVGDTDITDQQLQDEEIAYVLTQQGVLYAAAQCAEALQARYARKADITDGKMHVMASQRAKAYTVLAVTLRRQGALGVSPYAGGQSVADKITQVQDLDRVPGAFGVDLMEMPGTTPEENTLGTDNDLTS